MLKKSKSDLLFGPDVAGLQSPPIRHAYMSALAKYSATIKQSSTSIKLLEIGSWVGSSTITWARTFSSLFKDVDVVCVDPWIPYFDTDINTGYHYELMNRLAREEKTFDLFIQNIRAADVGHLVRYHKGTSREVLPYLKDSSFDLIYIDGSHAYDDVIYDIQQAKRLIIDGGIICGDDLELTLNEVDITHHIESYTNTIDSILDPKTQQPYHPGVTQAIAEEFAEINLWDGFWAVQYIDKRLVKIDLSDYELVIPQHLQMQPHLVESYHGFNLIKLENEFCCVRQSMGKIDFNVDKKQLMTSFNSSDLMFCATIEDAKSHIDEILGSVIEEVLE